MTYNEICMALANAEIENNRHEAGMLICHFCNINQAELLTRRDENFDSPELLAAVEKRTQRYPLQYILGLWDFCNETYRVTEDTLIPRSDTEKLVELAVRFLPENARFIDLCTGSGCVAISTLARRQDTRAVAVDLFDKTLEVARENAERNGVGERLIPVPREISAGCGMAWCADPDSEDALKQLMDKHGILAQGIFRCMI